VLGISASRCVYQGIQQRSLFVGLGLMISLLLIALFQRIFQFFKGLKLANLLGKVVIQVWQFFFFNFLEGNRENRWLARQVFLGIVFREVNFQSLGFDPKSCPQSLPQIQG
jgi:heme/copper-type cytochrome/quinol oxidase subunit 4